MNKFMSFTVALLLMVISSACGQHTTNPVLIKTSANYELPRLEIKTDCVKDTVRVGVSVIVRFDKCFGDTIKLTTPKEIYLLTFSNIDVKSENRNTSFDYKEIVFEEFDEEAFLLRGEGTLDNLDIPQKEETAQDVCIREALDAQFKLWLEEQPYSEMIGVERYYGHNSLALAYQVYLIPKE